MSDTYSESIPRAEALHPVQARPRLWARLLRRVIFWLVFLWIASEAVSVTMQHTGLRRVLTARIAAAFGRPVDVGSYHFSLWNGPTLEANSVIVGEDPRFGNEYFLRAESMTVRLRWASLLRGHIELGTLSLTRPSLNLVRNAAGDWNLGEWLPQPSGSPTFRVPVGPSLPTSPVRFRRIDVDGGRINFKNGDEKLPLAFVGVKGTVETDRPGRWTMNLDATPWRAAVVVQQAGTIHISGDLGGTSSRLRPAALDISWTDASISDVLRLAGGNDVGIRGALALAVSARTREQDDGWAIRGRAELRQVHRWDLALRSDTPSLNLIAQTNWHPTAPDIELSDVALEAPHSSAHGSGRIRWNRADSVSGEKIPAVQFAIFSHLDASDLLPWLRAFRPGVGESISVRGQVDVRANVVGMPVRVVDGTVSSAGLDFTGADPRTPVHLGQIQVVSDHEQVSFLPISLSWRAGSGLSDGEFRLDGATKPARGSIPGWHISGSTSQARDLIAAAAAFGWNLSRGWELAGPFACDLRWQAAPYPGFGGTSQPVGWVEFGGPGTGTPLGAGGDTLRAPFLNRPIEQIKARAEWKADSRHIALATAQAFGARWSGTFDRPDLSREWQFAISADHLAAGDLDRWLNPAWRQSFLDRMLPFLSPRAQTSAAPEYLRASGRLALDQFTLLPLVVRHLQGDLEIDGRHIVLGNATGQFYGGQISGLLDAELSAPPVYRADLDFSRVDISALAAATPGLDGFRAQSGAGQVSFVARGANRADLVSSLTCQGSVRASGPELLNFDMEGALGGRSDGTGSTRFPSGSATFSCGQQMIDIQTLSLATGVDTSANGSGTIDFSRNLDLRLRVGSALPSSDDRALASFRLTGPLAAPKVALPQATTHRSR
ncbi:MAG TPA: AsmA family protein [Candidatus Acidoferrales bacterium]